jgi:hypothetical protein
VVKESDWKLSVLQDRRWTLVLYQSGNLAFTKLAISDREKLHTGDPEALSWLLNEFSIVSEFWIRSTADSDIELLSRCEKAYLVTGLAIMVWNQLMSDEHIRNILLAQDLLGSTSRSRISR